MTEDKNVIYSDFPLIFNMQILIFLYAEQSRHIPGNSFNSNKIKLY